MRYGGNHFIRMNILFLLFLISGIKSLNKNLNEYISVLEENNIIKKYINKGENDTYQIIINEKNNTKSVFIELMIFSGDAILLLEEKEETGLIISRSQNINKFLYNISAFRFEEFQTDITLNVTALRNSYYSIRYMIDKINQKESKKYLLAPNNANFLVTIPPYDLYGMGNQKIQIINEFNSDFLLINFYFVNCQGIILIIKDGDPDSTSPLPSTNEYYYQDSKFKNHDNDNIYYYKAQITISEQGLYETQMCMLYVSCAEIGDDYLNPSEYILVGENVPQRIIFDQKIKKVKYLYQIPDINNDLAIKFLLIKRAEYVVNFYIKSFNIANKIGNTSIFSDQQEIIKSSDYIGKCREGFECSLIVEIKPTTKNVAELEVSIKSLTNLEIYPSYIIKNKIISDYLNYDSPNYFYTEIGSSFSGEVIVNYYRGNGMIYGAIVKKSKTNEKDPEWMGKYKFPKNRIESLLYVAYSKKLVFTNKDTTHCSKGCYLLLKLEHINNAIVDNSRYSGYDILIFTDVGNNEKRIIDLPLEKYVQGSISEKSNLDNYIINIPEDAEKVIFDLQGENLVVYISLYIKEKIKYNYYKYPTEEFHHWSFSTVAKKALYEISKVDINNIAEKDGIKYDDLTGVCLTIGIFQKFKDNSFSSIYALKYNLEYFQDFRIYEVYSDQQTLCKTVDIYHKNKFNCFYMLTYNKIDTNYDLIVYPILEDESKDIKIYADFIDRKTYDMNDIHSLNNLKPTKSSEFSTDIFKEDFLYISLKGKEDKYLYISLETDLNTTISLLSSILTFDYSRSPNPSTWQLYVINSQLILEFSLKEDLIINIEGIKGSANISWNEDDINHSISGRDDRISLTTSSSYNLSNITSNILMIHKESLPGNENRNILDSLFIYLSFNFRSIMQNFDEIQLGKSYNLVYRNTNFPLTIYIRNFDTNRDINAFISLYYLESQNKSMVKERKFKILGTILSDNHINNIRNNHYTEAIRYNPKYGVYDPSKRVGLVCFNRIEYEFYNLNYEKDKSSNLVIQIYEDKNNEEVKNPYFSISIETAVFQDDSLYPITEKVYQYGKLKRGEKIHTHKLTNNNFKKITCIIFSSNSDMIDKNFTISNHKLQIIEHYYVNGKDITFINSTSNEYSYIFLNIFTKNNKTVDDENIMNYAFKYINIDDLSEFYLYEVLNPNITYNKENSSIIINPVNCDNCLVTYFANFILRSTLVNGETFDNIAVIQSPGITKEFVKKDYEIINNKVILNISDIPTGKDYAHIQVIAYVHSKRINEYIAYNSLHFEKKNDNNGLSGEKKNDKTFLIITYVLGGVMIILIIIFLAIILKCNKKNKDLINKVNATSFQNDNLGCFNQEDENNPNLLME